MADHMIDNFSANHVNTATTQEEKQLNEGLDVFSGSSSSCCGPRSLSLASRMTSVAPCGGCRSWQHLRLDRVVWQVSGRYRKAQHRCVLFGTTSSMAAWWHFGRLLSQPADASWRGDHTLWRGFQRRASRRSEGGTQWPGTLTLLMDLLNTQTDISRSLNKVVRTVVLGADVVVDMAARPFAYRVAAA